MTKKKGDYEVGYGKPPRHSQFPPGVSGNLGRRKRPESQKEIVARLRDEPVEVNGQKVSKFELAVAQTINQTIRSGKPRDLKLLLDLLEQYGALPEADQYAEAQRGANAVFEKIKNYRMRQLGRDPADFDELDRIACAEAEQVMACTRCGPALKKQWATPERKDLSKRFDKSPLHRQVERAVLVRNQANN